MAEEAEIEDICDPSFLESASQIEAQLFFDRTAPVVCLFGRRENGESICVRVEGFRPRLYFLPAPGESVNDIVREMERMRVKEAKRLQRAKRNAEAKRAAELFRLRKAWKEILDEKDHV